MKVVCSLDCAHYFSRPGAFEHRMAYVLGLQQLGHEVCLIEEIDPKRCFDRNHNMVSFQDWEGRQHFESLAKSYAVWPRCCLIYSRGQATHGMSFADALKTARESALLLNIGGHLNTPEILENIPRRAFLDINPAKTQVYYSEYGVDRGFERHHYFFTFGLNIGRETCEIPTCGRTWLHFLPAVNLPLWPAQIDGERRRFTTISTWKGRRTFYFKGRFSGEKADGWLKFIEIPKKTSQELEIALDIGSGYESDLELFVENGWRLADPKQFHDLGGYRNYIAGSRAELSIAHNRYVEFKTGWVSDRSARYLASGKPVLVQSTGIEDHLPTGKGLLTFTTMEEAVAGIDAINRDYPAHCSAARAIAEEYFDSTKVLARMLAQMGF